METVVVAPPLACTGTAVCCTGTASDPLYATIVNHRFHAIGNKYQLIVNRDGRAQE